MRQDDVDFGQVFETLGKHAPRGYALGLHLQYTSTRYLLQSYPNDWLAVYNEKGLVMSDPTVSWCMENTGSCRWSDLEDSAGVLALAAEYGMKYGMVAATESGGTRSMCGFARHDREYTDEEIITISGLFEQLHAATAAQASLPPHVVAQLKRMSVLLTQTKK